MILQEKCLGGIDLKVGKDEHVSRIAAMRLRSSENQGTFNPKTLQESAGAANMG